jgi:hypothetical protein
MRANPYASAFESIMYAMLCTCPDVSYALSATSRYESNYGETHWTIVKNILKYLRRTKEAFRARSEAELVIFSSIGDVFSNTCTSLEEIDIFITNSSTLTTTRNIVI